MRKLTVRPRLGSGNVKLLERAIGHEFSDNFRVFMMNNAGLSHFECLYTDSRGTDWEVAQYNQYRDLIRLTREFKENGLGPKVPFAYEPGGWHYCLSFDPDTYGKVIVNRWTDHTPEDQFLVIADSFEDFINGLRRRPDEPT